MAKWGEGDPRWIVEERPDATNVNNWHWSEKNATAWSQTKIRSLLEGFVIQTDEGSLKLTEIKKLEGEASANNRKAKLIFFYEWTLTCGWEGSLKGSEDTHEGKIEIPNLSDENGPEDLDVTVTAKDNDDASYKLKELMRLKGISHIREQLGKYIRDLKEEFSRGLILPTKQQEQGTNLNTAPVITDALKKASLSKEKTTDKRATDSPTSGLVLISTTTVDLKEQFKCPADELFKAFLAPEMVQAFTNGPALVEPIKGGKFRLYGGTVEGSFMEIDRNAKIVMQWRIKSYPPGHFSVVTLSFHQKDDHTELQLRQTQVPEAQASETEQGWRRHYFEAIKRTFGYGAQLL